MLIFKGHGRGGLAELRFISNTHLLARYVHDGFCVFDVPAQTVRYDNRMEFVVAATPLPDERIAFATFSRTISYVAWSEPKPRVNVLSSGITSNSDICWYPPGNALLTGMGTRQAMAYDGTTWEERSDLAHLLHLDNLREAYANCIHISESGRWAIVYGFPWQQPLRVFDLNQPQVGKQVPLSIRHPDRFVFSPDDRFALVWSAFKLYLIDLEERKFVRDFQACTRKVRAACFTPDSRAILQVSDDRMVRMFDRQTGEIIREYTWDIGKLRAVAVSPDGSIAAAGASAATGKIVVWDLE